MLAVEYGIEKGQMQITSETQNGKIYSSEGYYDLDGTFIKGSVVTSGNGSIRSIELSEVSVWGRTGKYYLNEDGSEGFADLIGWEMNCNNFAMDNLPYRDASDEDFSLVLTFTDGTESEHDFKLERDEEGHLIGTASFSFAGIEQYLQFDVGCFLTTTKVQTVEIRQTGTTENLEPFDPSIFTIWVSFDNGFVINIQGLGVVHLENDDGVVSYGDRVYADVYGDRYYLYVEIAQTPHILMDAYIEQTADFLEGDEFDPSAFTVYGIYKDGVSSPIDSEISIDSVDGRVHDGAIAKVMVLIGKDEVPTEISLPVKCYEIKRIYPMTIPLYLIYGEDGTEPEELSLSVIAVYGEDGNERYREIGMSNLDYEIDVDAESINTTEGVPATIIIHAGTEGNRENTSISTEAIKLQDYVGSYPRKILNMEIYTYNPVNAGDPFTDDNYSLLIRNIDLSTIQMNIGSLPEIVKLEAPSGIVQDGNTATVTVTLDASTSVTAGTFTTVFPIAVLEN